MLWRYWFQTASPILQTTAPTTITTTVTVTIAQDACSHHASSPLPLVLLPHRIRHMADSTASPRLNSPPPPFCTPSLCEYQCYWYAHTVWEVLKRIFPDRFETSLKESPVRSSYRGVMNDKADSVDEIFTWYREEWTSIEEAAANLRRAKEEEVQQVSFFLESVVPFTHLSLILS
ncbi:hypothetical protein BDR07DRAFT_1392836 [Suillus spraguei]|nr:hypothetical protein BDR07DRAFT_1392836 [Suillus spraguei]